MTKKEPFRILSEDEATDPTVPDRIEPKPGHVWVKNIFERWALVAECDRGNPCVDPSYERYWCM